MTSLHVVCYVLLRTQPNFVAYFYHKAHKAHNEGFLAFLCVRCVLCGAFKNVHLILYAGTDAVRSLVPVFQSRLRLRLQAMARVSRSETPGRS